MHTEGFEREKAVARLRVVQIPSLALLDRRGPSQTVSGHRHGREYALDPDGVSL